MYDDGDRNWSLFEFSLAYLLSATCCDQLFTIVNFLQARSLCGKLSISLPRFKRYGVSINVQTPKVLSDVDYDVQQNLQAMVCAGKVSVCQIRTCHVNPKPAVVPSYLPRQMEGGKRREVSISHSRSFERGAIFSQTFPRESHLQSLR